MSQDSTSSSNSVTRRQKANAIRALAMDAVQRANSGHPGMPMGMADIAEVLWCDFLQHNPANPSWPNRDRFVLSNGHGSMLLYSLLHLTGYDLSIDELRNFRQLHSQTPGHPEYGYAPGVETTTGPLGQGIANAVGMALSEKVLAAQFNRGGHNIVDHNTYAFLGDGCLMEGISHEVCSLAGTLGLSKLICFWDNNGISIDGEVKGWFTDNTAMRFESYGWHVIRNVDGHDGEAVKAAIEMAQAETGKPTLIDCVTTIGFGSPNKGGTGGVHGAPLGDDEIKRVREQIGWPHEPFHVPDEISNAWGGCRKGADTERAWNEKFSAYGNAYPELAAEFTRRSAGELPQNWAQHADAFFETCVNRKEKVASRKASQIALNGYCPVLPEMLGGSADLTGSNLTNWSGSRTISKDNADGNYISYGVREFGMAAIGNGIALHGGLIPYSGTFLMFSEYARNALRMAALMKIRNIFVFTHDSIGLGEDGPTHQAVEQAATLRLLPNMSVWRPCDTVETAVAWRHAIERTDGPTALLLSRQSLPHQPRTAEQRACIKRGGYVMDGEDHADKPLDVILIATGSEVEIAHQATHVLREYGLNARLVCIPSTDVFDQQDVGYKESVLPAGVRARVAVEAGVSDGWRKYVGLDGAVVGLDTFGESGPAEQVFEHFGFTVDNVVDTVKALISKS